MLHTVYQWDPALTKFLSVSSSSPGDRAFSWTRVIQLYGYPRGRVAQQPTAGLRICCVDHNSSVLALVIPGAHSAGARATWPSSLHWTPTSAHLASSRTHPTHPQTCVQLDREGSRSALGPASRGCRTRGCVRVPRASACVRATGSPRGACASLSQPELVTDIPASTARSRNANRGGTDLVLWPWPGGRGRSHVCT